MSSRKAHALFAILLLLIAFMPSPAAASNDAQFGRPIVAPQILWREAQLTTCANVSSATPTCIVIDLMVDNDGSHIQEFSLTREDARKNRRAIQVSVSEDTKGLRITDTSATFSRTINAKNAVDGKEIKIKVDLTWRQSGPERPFEGPQIPEEPRFLRQARVSGTIQIGSEKPITVSSNAGVLIRCIATPAQ